VSAGRALIRRALAAGIAAATTREVRRRLDQSPPGGSTAWTRTNHAGESVTLLEGPALVGGLVAGTLAAPGSRLRTRVVTAAALGVVGGVGAHDDLKGSSTTKGIRGHIGALRHGEVTSGAVKIGVIGLTGLVAAAALRRERGQPDSLTGTLLDGALIAGTANLLNLLDLRPGRALKVALATAPIAASAAPASSGLIAPTAGAGAAALPDDLAGKSMMGDCGANTLGAALGCALVEGTSAPARRLLLGGVVGLTLLSERVSFSAVIESTPWLRRLDELGRVRHALGASGASDDVTEPVC
jgi:UDP-N-acetylmuramyl pentapeptide phosphotransferase/UDP-N-acetylglucosamine-1-phosphate transferase